MRVLLILAFVFAAFPDSTRAEVREGVLIAGTLVSADGTQAWPLMWSDCSAAAEPMEYFRCISAGLKYHSHPTECIVADLELARPPPGYSYELEPRLLVRRIIHRAPYIKADGGRACRIAGEALYRGLYSVAYEHQGFTTQDGELWWIDNASSLSGVGATHMRLGGGLRFRCIEVWGVALPARALGYGLHGGFSRDLFVTQVGEYARAARIAGDIR